MNKLKTALYGALLLPATAVADSPLKQGVDIAHPTDEAGNKVGPHNLFGTGGAFGTIADLLIFLVGALAVIVIIYGGFRYVTSTGDAGRVKQAKDTILYGVVGLVFAILAYAIVKFITSNIK